MAESQNNVFLPDLCTTRAVLVVVVASELMAIVISLVAGYFEPFGFERLALTSLFIQWIALTSAALVCQLRGRLNRLPQAWAALSVVALVAFDTLVFSLLARALMSWVSAAAMPPLWHWDILANVLIAAIISGLVMRYFYVQEQLRVKDRAELKSRIQALQSRIRPHFLFNSMNIIATLIRIDPDAAEQAVEDLSSLFRASLKDSGSEVTLAEELALCERYIRIEQLRLGERLGVEWRIELEPESVALPLLTLQPLLENAIYHGIQPLTGGGWCVSPPPSNRAGWCCASATPNGRAPASTRATAWRWTTSATGWRPCTAPACRCRPVRNNNTTRLKSATRSNKRTG